MLEQNDNDTPEELAADEYLRHLACRVVAEALAGDGEDLAKRMQAEFDLSLDELAIVLAAASAIIERVIQISAEQILLNQPARGIA